MINNFRKIINILIVLNISLLGFSFEWPLPKGMDKNIVYYFAQYKGNTFVQSLEFLEESPVVACEDARVLIKFTEENDSGWFDSPLGNAVVLSHENNLLSIYSSLGDISIGNDVTDIAMGTKIGNTGFTGWNDKLASLGFQVIDRENQVVINPLVLMNQEEGVNPVSIKNVVAINKKGKIYDLATQKYMSPGIYQLYMEKNTMPFKTQVSVNGAIVETVQYDVLTQEDNRLCISGRRKYTVENIYAESKRQFLAEIVLSRGKNTILITTSDIKGNERYARFFLEVK